MLDASILNKMYPEAYSRYVLWLNNKYATNGSKIYYHNDYLYYDRGHATKLFDSDIRHLFDFFDDFNIVIEVFKEHVLGSETATEYWCFSVDIIISKGYPNRKFAENAAFKQGFRILQNKEK